MPENEVKTDELEKLVTLLSERVSCLERIVALQHQENGRLYAAVQTHQEIFDRMVAQELAAPVN
jgi:chorismate mutase